MATLRPALVLALLVCCTAAARAECDGVPPGPVTCTDFADASILAKLPGTTKILTLKHASLTHFPVGSLDKLSNLKQLNVEMNLTCGCDTMYLTKLSGGGVKIVELQCKYNNGGSDAYKEVRDLTGNEFPGDCTESPPSCREMLLRDSGLHIAYLLFLAPLVYSYLGLRPLVSHRRDTHLLDGQATYVLAEYARIPSMPDPDKIYEDLDVKQTTTKM